VVVVVLVSVVVGGVLVSVAGGVLCGAFWAAAEVAASAIAAIEAMMTLIVMLLLLGQQQLNAQRALRLLSGQPRKQSTVAPILSSSRRPGPIGLAGEAAVSARALIAHFIAPSTCMHSKPGLSLPSSMRRGFEPNETDTAALEDLALGGGRLRPRDSPDHRLPGIAADFRAARRSFTLDPLMRRITGLLFRRGGSRGGWPASSRKKGSGPTPEIFRAA
jgi:hypothetical protein